MQLRVTQRKMSEIRGAIGHKTLLAHTVKCLMGSKTKDRFPNESLPRPLFLCPISLLSLWALGNCDFFFFVKKKGLSYCLGCDGE